MKEYRLSPRQVRFLSDAYREIPDYLLKDELNALEPLSRPAVSIKCISFYAKRMNLKKDMAKVRINNMNHHIMNEGRDFHRYSGNSAEEIARAIWEGISVILNCGSADMKKIKAEISRYNNTRGKSSGIKVEGIYDYARKIVFLKAKATCRTFPYTSLFSRVGVLYVPP